MTDVDLEKIFNSPELQSEDINSHLSVAHNFIAEGSNDVALLILTETTKRFPQNDKAFFELGYLLYELGNVNDAVVNLKRSIEIDPAKNLKKYFTLAEISNPKDAVCLYETGISLYQQKFKEPCLDGELTRIKAQRNKQDHSTSLFWDRGNLYAQRPKSYKDLRKYSIIFTA